MNAYFLGYGLKQGEIAPGLTQANLDNLPASLQTKVMAQLVNVVRRIRDDNAGASNAQAMGLPYFRKACELAGIEPTRRQASKWNNKRGLAWDKRMEAKKALAAGRAA